jgi:DEAD/DEAH box helicase domain-containing protein
MKAYNFVGWLFGQPQIPFLQDDSQRDVIAPDYSGLHRPAWWRSGDHLGKQFTHFLRSEAAAEVRPQIEALLKATGGAAISFSELLDDTIYSFEGIEAGWCADYSELIKAWAVPGLARRNRNAVAHQARSLWTTTVIEELGARRFLPRYGFPIGLQSLTVPEVSGGGQAPVRLQRDGILAVSEYVPGSTVLAGGRTYTSHAVLRSWASGAYSTEFGQRAWKYSCTLGHNWYTYLPAETADCGVPGCQGRRVDQGQNLLIPKYGYSTAVWDPPSWLGAQERVGRTQITTTSFISADVKTLVWRISVDWLDFVLEPAKAVRCWPSTAVRINSDSRYACDVDSAIVRRRLESAERICRTDLKLTFTSKMHTAFAGPAKMIAFSATSI